MKWCIFIGALIYIDIHVKAKDIWWAVTQFHILPASPVDSAIKSLDAVAAIGAAGVSDMDQLSKWIAQSRLDPNDPSNAELMHRVKVNHQNQTNPASITLYSLHRYELEWLRGVPLVKIW